VSRWTPIILQKMNVRTLWKGQSPMKQKKKRHRVEAINVGALSTLRTLGHANQRKMVVVNLDQLAHNEETARDKQP
jgi:hypothetical protein